jgi:hypothetical protein
MQVTDYGSVPIPVLPDKDGLSVRQLGLANLEVQLRASHNKEIIMLVVAGRLGNSHNAVRVRDSGGPKLARWRMKKITFLNPKMIQNIVASFFFFVVIFVIVCEGVEVNAPGDAMRAED